MPSAIKYLNINENFPIAGEDNDSQVFRDNFTTIKNSFATAKMEIDDIQSSLESFELSNNVNNATVFGTNLQGITYNVNTTYFSGVFFNNEDVLEINYQNGNIFIIRANDDFNGILPIKLINWPTQNYGFIRLILYGDGTERTISWINQAGEIITDPDFLDPIIISDPTYPKIIEIYTFDAGNTLYLRYISNVDTDQTISDITTISDIETATPVSQNAISIERTILSKYKANQKLRLFGASSTQSFEELGNSEIANVTSTGFNSSETNTVFAYKMAVFNFVTGKISAAETTESSINIPTNDLDSFNNGKNIILTISRDNINQGVLIYRSIGGISNDYKLIAVLGPKALGLNTQNISYIDYYTFDQNTWSSTDSSNAFTELSGIMHIPVIAPTSPRLGWADVTIDSIDLVNSNINLTENYFFENNITIVNDDTEEVQTEINTRYQNGVNYYEFESRDYYIKELKIPTNFTLYGGDARIIKQFWSTSSSNHLFYADPTYLDFKNIKLSNITLDGNFLNQYLVSDVTGASVHDNYICYLYGTNITIDRVTIENTVGGGIFLQYVGEESKKTENLVINNCVVQNGGSTYRYEEYSPLYAPEVKNSKITINTFKNYASSVELTAANTILFTQNIVENCGSGVVVYGSTNSIYNPNVLLGPAGEFLPLTDNLNSEYDSVNILIEKNIDYNGYSGLYQENGEFFDLSNIELVGEILELRKINGVEELADDYSTFPVGYAGPSSAGDSYIQFDQSVDKSRGEFRFRITAEAVNNLLERASFESLYTNNPNAQGLVYRVIATEYVERATIVSGRSAPVDYQYIIEVDDITPFPINSIIKLTNHNITPSVNTLDAIVLSTNSISKEITIEFITQNTAYINLDGGVGGTADLKNSFVLVKGRIN